MCKIIKRRDITKTNNYPTHQSFRHISSVLRDENGFMCFSEEYNGELYIRQTNINDISDIKPNILGQRRFRRNYIETHLRNNITNSNYTGKLYMYCIHEVEQRLRPTEDFTTNKSYPHLRPNQNIHGLQPFCKDSKKKYVNNGPAGNHSRTKDQYLEDLGSRFRQKLIVSVLGTIPKISYEDIYNKFNGCCFKCQKHIPFERTDLKQLDHTLPHVYWWPYTTENATLLCNDCNQSKKDKWPSIFYSDIELKKLSNLTGIDYQLLSSPVPLYNSNLINIFLEDFDSIIKMCEKRFRKRKSLVDFHKKVIKESMKLSKSSEKNVKLLSEKMYNYSEKMINEYGL